MKVREGERVFWPMAIAGALFALAQKVLQLWMPGYVAAGIAGCACFACAGVYIQPDPRHRFRVLLAAVAGGAFASAIRFIWP